ncbi:MAG TPA: 50S ribosomal protein L5, partial [Thermotogota bacterium]|nr:50S ribosomal protein L5 [Thermotogota bacterium]
EELMATTGQKPVITKAKRAISNFKIRKGMAVGIKVTLRGKVMENFLFKLFNIVLPKVRDFRGLNPNSFDGKGNYSFGLSEQVIFPEIRVEKVKRVQGMDIIIVTSAKNNEEAKALLSSLGLPFKKG